MTLEGTVARVKFHSADNGYSILDVYAGKAFPDTIVGYIPQIKEGDKLKAEGDWTTHPKFGAQFKASYIEVAAPNTEAGIVAFLTTMVKGIGETRAKMIVKKFGKETIKIIDSTPGMLREIPGIGETRLNAIVESWQASREMRNTMVYLQGFGVTPGFAVKIWKFYKEKTKEVLREDPYKITDIWGIGFKIADKIAMQMGMPVDSPARAKAGVLYALNNAAETEGHVFLKSNELRKKVLELLAVEDIDIEPHIHVLAKEEKIVVEGEAIYHPFYWEAEAGAATNIKRIMESRKDPIKIRAEAFISKYEKENNITFSEEQTQAITMMTSNTGAISVTGLPGTGKTSVCKALMSLFEAENLTYSLCAPTGKAAERLSQVTGREAKTVHRLLGSRGDFFEYNRKNTLKTDVVLCDETSMVDMVLFWRLTEAIASGTRLVLIGDTAQLPSVGAGNVLGDIVASGAVPVIALKKIFRQAEASPIILNAHRINAGEKVAFGGDFTMVDAENDGIPHLLRKAIPELMTQYGEVQVLSPMHKGESGVGRLNEELQNALNPPMGQGQMTRGFLTLRVADRVVQLKNNYDKEVFNGMTGRVADIDTENDKVFVEFSGRIVEYDFDETDELKLSYALTVHKSQGSEFECVVLCLTTSHYIQLNRKLLYTGVTRAKKQLIIIGQKKALYMAINNDMVKTRNSNLANKLCKG